MAEKENPPLAAPHAMSGKQVLASLQTSIHGLTQSEIAGRLQRYGRNTLPRTQPSGIGTLFLSQFASPLIYVLVAAALLSVLIREWSDAGFIAAVLLINAIIGTIQEYSAQRAAVALRELVTTCCRVLRNGDSYEIDAEELVPGDIVLLESGDRIPADLRLLACHDLEADESLLTGESIPVLKNADQILKAEAPMGDRRNMAFAGSLVGRGRGQGVVVGTGLDTELGRIAAAVLGKRATKAPSPAAGRRVSKSQYLPATTPLPHWLLPGNWNWRTTLIRLLPVHNSDRPRAAGASIN